MDAKQQKKQASEVETELQPAHSSNFQTLYSIHESMK